MDKLREISIVFFFLTSFANNFYQALFIFINIQSQIYTSFVITFIYGVYIHTHVFLFKKKKTFRFIILLNWLFNQFPLTQFTLRYTYEKVKQFSLYASYWKIKHLCLIVTFSNRSVIWFMKNDLYLVKEKNERAEIYTKIEIQERNIILLIIINYAFFSIIISMILQESWFFNQFFFSRSYISDDEII